MSSDGSELIRPVKQQQPETPLSSLISASSSETEKDKSSDGNGGKNAAGVLADGKSKKQQGMILIMWTILDVLGSMEEVQTEEYGEENVGGRKV